MKDFLKVFTKAFEIDKPKRLKNWGKLPQLTLNNFKMTINYTGLTILSKTGANSPTLY